MSQHTIDLLGINKSFGDTEVIKDLNLYIRKNEFITLLGPSGCGKTTILRMIGGFEEPDSGSILFDGNEIIGVPPHKRKVNTVFQKYSLFPNMNVFENIAFGLRIKKVPEKTIGEKVAAMLELVNLEGFEKRTVDSLSGGQQQRVAIARALINEPEVLLLDEPLGALDLKLRKELQLELKRIQKRLGITFIYVTHDQEEALTMSDTIVVINNGVIQQIDTPVDIYNEPKNAFVAQFIGESNLLSGVMLKDRLAEFVGVKFPCVDSGFEREEDVDVVIRPEDIKIVPVSEGQLTGTVEDIVFKGVHYDIMVHAAEFDWLVQSTVMPETGTQVGLRIAPEDIHIMKIANNMITAHVTKDNLVELGGAEFECEAKAEDFDPEESVNVFIRPQDIKVVSEDKGKLSGTVESFLFKGDDYEALVQLEDFPLIIHTYQKLTTGQRIGLDFPRDSIKIKKRGLPD